MKVVIGPNIIDGVTGFSFDERTNTLKLTTDQVVPKPDPQPEPEPFDPNLVSLAYPFNLNGQKNTPVIIPATKILSSQFDTVDKKDYGSVKFYTESGDEMVDVNYWVSETPGGAPVDGKIRAANFIYDLRWSTIGARNKLNLEKGRVYFLNMQHQYKRDNTSRIYRTVV